MDEYWHCKFVMGGLNETINYEYAVSLDQRTWFADYNVVFMIKLFFFCCETSEKKKT